MDVTRGALDDATPAQRFVLAPLAAGGQLAGCLLVVFAMVIAVPGMPKRMVFTILGVVGSAAWAATVAWGFRTRPRGALAIVGRALGSLAAAAAFATLVVASIVAVSVSSDLEGSAICGVVGLAGGILARRLRPAGGSYAWLDPPGPVDPSVIEPPPSGAPPRGATSYALAGGGPPPPPEWDVDETTCAITVRWDDRTLLVKHLDPSRRSPSFSVGDPEAGGVDLGLDADVLGCTRARVVSMRRDGTAVVLVPPAADAVVEVGGRPARALAEAVAGGAAEPIEGAHRIRVALGERVTLRLGAAAGGAYRAGGDENAAPIVTIAVEIVRAGRPPGRAAFRAGRPLAFVLGALALHAVLLRTSAALPPREIDPDEQAFAIRLALPPEPEDEELEQSEDGPVPSAREQWDARRHGWVSYWGEWYSRADADLGLVALGMSPVHLLGWSGDGEQDTGGVLGPLGLIGIGEPFGDPADLDYIATRVRVSKQREDGAYDGIGRGFGGLDVAGGSHRVRVPRVQRIRVWSGSGSLPEGARDAIAVIARARTARMRACYAHGLADNADLQGTVRVRLAIGHDGRADPVGNAGSDVPDYRVVGCVIGAFRGLAGFPRPRTGGAVVVIDVSLAATDAPP